MATWPATLPDYFLARGFSEGMPDLRVESEMDEGPPYYRRWGTGDTYPVSGTIIMTKAQVATFKTFVNDTLVGATLSFEWEHPRTGATVDLTFSEIPSWSPVERTNGQYYYVTIKLDVLP